MRPGYCASERHAHASSTGSIRSQQWWGRRCRLHLSRSGREIGRGDNVRDVRDLPRAVKALSDRLAELGWVRDLLVGGSLATGDYRPGVSDLDLVAVVDDPIDSVREARLVGIHRDPDRGPAACDDLGCVYVAASLLTDPSARHPTWTHGSLVYRTLSAITRAELARHGLPAYGR